MDPIPTQDLFAQADCRTDKFRPKRALTKASYQRHLRWRWRSGPRPCHRQTSRRRRQTMLLPKLKGREVLQKLEANRATACIPVLVLSSLAQKNEESASRRALARSWKKAPSSTTPASYSGPSKKP
jgi:hypothetical protein